MGGFLLLAENRSVPYPRSPFSFGHLLHLLYEFAPSNGQLLLAAHAAVAAGSLSSPAAFFMIAPQQNCGR